MVRSLVQLAGDDAELKSALDDASQYLRTTVDAVFKPQSAAKALVQTDEELDEAKRRVRKILLMIDERRQKSVSSDDRVLRWTAAGRVLFAFVLVITAAIVYAWLTKASQTALGGLGVVGGVSTLVGLAATPLRNIDAAERDQRRYAEAVLVAWAKLETCTTMEGCRVVLDGLTAGEAG